jgi:hypothetical protein
LKIYNFTCRIPCLSKVLGVTKVSREGLEHRIRLGRWILKRELGEVVGCKGEDKSQVKNGQ